MPEIAMYGTYPHPGIPGADMTCGRDNAVPWLQQYLGRPQLLAVDIETYGLGADMRRIKCVVLALPDHVLVLDPRDPYQAALLGRALAYAPGLVMHVATADAPSLCANQLLRPQDIYKIVDTVIYARMAEPGDHGGKTLEQCAAKYLGLKGSNGMTEAFRTLGYSKQEGFLKTDVDSPAYVMGAAADGLVTARLLDPVMSAAYRRQRFGHPFEPLGESETWAELEKQQRVNRMSLRRTVKGLRLDIEYLTRYRDSIERERSASETVLRAGGIAKGPKGDFLGSSLVAKLGEDGALPLDHPVTKKTRTPSTAAKDLEQLNHPLAREFVKVKQLDKISGYMAKAVANADEHGRIHPYTNILAAAHGRQSIAGDAELHQYPHGARGIILPDEGDGFAGVDWAQQEPMFALNDAQDVGKPLLDYENHGIKIYNGISAMANIPYDAAKVVLLAGMYGEGIIKLSNDLDLDPGPFQPRQDRESGEWLRDERGDLDLFPTYAAAKDIQDRAFSATPRLRERLETLKDVARRYQLIQTMNGRIVPIPSGIQPWDGKWSVQSHKGPNYRICGSASDMLTDTMIAIEDAGLSEGWYWGMHDEGLVSKYIAREVQRIMETPSERFIQLAGRRPVIHTDVEIMNERWK